jgi:hypothetical protein
MDNLFSIESDGPHNGLSIYKGDEPLVEVTPSQCVDGVVIRLYPGALSLPAEEQVQLLKTVKGLHEDRPVEIQRTW